MKITTKQMIDVRDWDDLVKFSDSNQEYFLNEVSEERDRSSCYQDSDYITMFY